MPTNRVRYLNTLVDNWLEAIEQDTKLETRQEYRRLVLKATEALEATGLNSTPSKVGKEEVYFLREEYYLELEPKTNRSQLSIFGKYLKHYDNNIVEKLHLPWPQGERLSVKWLAPEQCVALLDAAQGIERILVHLELMLLMRRCEVKRLTIQDVQLNLINVHGKGRNGGKWRNLPWAMDTLLELQQYQKIRENIISSALSQKPQQTIPSNFLIYAQYGWKLGAYQDTAIDAMLKKVAVRAGVPPEDVSNHVLRRSGAMMMDEAGVEEQDISDMLGHADLKQTRKYLGRTVKKLARAQEAYASYLESVRASMKENPQPVAMYRRAPLITR